MAAQQTTDEISYAEALEACRDAEWEYEGRGYVLRRDAVLYANEQAAEVPCPDCGPLEVD